MSLLDHTTNHNGHCEECQETNRALKLTLWAQIQNDL